MGTVRGNPNTVHCGSVYTRLDRPRTLFHLGGLYCSAQMRTSPRLCSELALPALWPNAADGKHPQADTPPCPCCAEMALSALSQTASTRRPTPPSSRRESSASPWTETSLCATSHSRSVCGGWIGGWGGADGERGVIQGPSGPGRSCPDGRGVGGGTRQCSVIEARAGPSWRPAASKEPPLPLPCRMVTR